MNIKKFLKDNIRYILLVIALVCFAFPMYRMHRSNKLLLENLKEKQEKLEHWQAKELEYQLRLDSFKKKENEALDSIASLNVDIKDLIAKIKRLQYEKNVDDHVDGLSDDELLRAIRSRYSNSH